MVLDVASRAVDNMRVSSFGDVPSQRFAGFRATPPRFHGFSLSKKHINPKLVPYALNEAEPAQFERFGHAFYAAIIGKQFVPLGGLHDGGADGFFEPELWQDAQAKHFLQVSKQGEHAPKIQQTVGRLREFGREPAAVTYLTSRIVPHIDVDWSAAGFTDTELRCLK